MAPDDYVCGCDSEDQVSVYKTFGQIPSSLIETEKGPPSFFTNGKKKLGYITQGHGVSSSQTKAHRYGSQVLSPICFMMWPNLGRRGCGEKGVTEEKAVNFWEANI